VLGAGDKLLCYLTWFISSCLLSIPAKIAKSEADKNMYQLAMSNFVLPGEKNFILAGLVQNPKNRNEAGKYQRVSQPPSSVARVNTQRRTSSCLLVAASSRNSVPFSSESLPAQRK